MQSFSELVTFVIPGFPAITTSTAVAGSTTKYFSKVLIDERSASMIAFLPKYYSTPKKFPIWKINYHTFLRPSLLPNQDDEAYCASLYFGCAFCPKWKFLESLTQLRTSEIFLLPPLSSLCDHIKKEKTAYVGFCVGECPKCLFGEIIFGSMLSQTHFLSEHHSSSVQRERVSEMPSEVSEEDMKTMTNFLHNTFFERIPSSLSSKLAGFDTAVSEKNC